MKNHYVDLLTELRVHCVNLHDVDSTIECDKLLKLIKSKPKVSHKNILRKYVGKIIPKSNVVYRLSPWQTNDWNNVQRNSKKRMVQEG